MANEYLCNEQMLEDLIAKIFEKHGFSYEDGLSIAKQLVIADMRGMRSHGAVRVDMYLKQAEGGAINPKAVPEVVRETMTTALIDAHRSAGAVASALAVRIVREKAEKCGIAIVTVRNSNHHGTCGYWGIEISQDDMISFVTTNAPALMAAPASKKAIIGNNPISCVVPANGKHMCLDISNGVMAFGKIHEYKRLNKPFPEGAWLDKNGNPTTDPFANEFLEFISLPIAAHKGFGIAVMAETITSILSGGAVAADIVPEGSDTNHDNDTAHCFVAINTAAFCEPSEYRARIDRFIDYIHNAETRTAGDYIYYPGEIENNAYAKSLSQGVPIPDTTKEYLCKTAKESGIAVPSNLFVEK